MLLKRVGGKSSEKGKGIVFEEGVREGEPEVGLVIAIKTTIDLPRERGVSLY